MNLYAIGASFLGTAVELIEALTIILAVGTIRGWKSSLLGAMSAILVLAVLIGIVGEPLTRLIQVWYVQLIVGLFMLLFGIRWLRKAVLRYSGLKDLHDEAESFAEELERQRNAGAVAPGIDRFAFSTTFSGTFLEGLEAVFIVITFGLSVHSMKSAIAGAILATLVVAGTGILLRKPLSKVPENTMKFVVGIMLSSFGAFWVGESMNVNWPQSDVSILYIAASLCILSFIIIQRCKVALGKATLNSNHDTELGA